eukprot:scaffold34685_cov183-Amphora_coffeaeformis.AAC.18
MGVAARQQQQQYGATTRAPNNNSNNMEDTVDGDLQRALEKFAISKTLPNEQEMDEIVVHLENKLCLGLPRNVYEGMAQKMVEDMVKMNIGEKNRPTDSCSQSTQPASSSDQDSSNTDVEFSTRPTPLRNAGSSDSTQSSSQPDYSEQRRYNHSNNNSNGNTSFGDRYQSSNAHNGGGGAALLNMQNTSWGPETEHGTPNRDTGLEGIGTATCTPGRTKRTPTKQGHRQPNRAPAGLGIGIFGNKNGYVAQNNTLSPTSTSTETPTASRNPLSKIICGKSQRDREFEQANIQRQSQQSTVPTPSTFSFNPSFNSSFPAPSPIAANNTGASTTTPVTRRPHSTPAARPGLQEKEEQQGSSRCPSPVAVGERAAESKPSPRSKSSHHSSEDDDGTQQPVAARSFFSPMVRTVNSQTSSNSTATMATLSQDDEDYETPASRARVGDAGTPMDYTPYHTTPTTQTPATTRTPMAPVSFIAGTNQFPDDGTPIATSRSGPTPYRTEPLQQPLQVQPPVVPQVPVQQAPVTQPIPVPLEQAGGFNLGKGKSKATKLKKATNYTKRGNAARANNQPTGLSSNEYNNSEASRVPSPMAVDDQNYNSNTGVNSNIELNDGFQIGAKKNIRKPKPPKNIGSKFRRPGDNVAQPFVANTANQPVANQPVAMQLPTPPPPPPEPDYRGKLELVDSKKSEAREAYMQADYRSSVEHYTIAIRTFKELSGTPLFDGDAMALLLSNRAAALLMLGALDAAVDDCRNGLEFVSDGGPQGERFTSDSGPPLRLKLQIRLGRALLRNGCEDEARLASQQAIETAEHAVSVSRRVHPPQIAENYTSSLGHQEREAALGLEDAIKVQQILEEVRRILDVVKNSDKSFLDAVKGYADALHRVNLALQIANGSVDLVSTKVRLLALMKRWRELAGVLERYAALNVKLDGVYTGDLAVKNPFPGVAPAKTLRADYFDGAREEDPTTASQKLNSGASAEAVLRMPYKLTGFYLRALRLQERYPAAKAAIKALEDLVNNGTTHNSTGELRGIFGWLPAESSKLKRTMEVREKGDAFFKSGQFEEAAREYGYCLTIDGEGQPKPKDGDFPNAGGRLHAVLHCNRAAANMSAQKHEEALEDCSKAIRIHSRYMKAILRRARCLCRLFRFEESISEFGHWLELAEQARKSKGPPPISACMFDGPGDATDKDIETARRELETAHQGKRRADAANREEARRRQEERQKWNDAFSSASSANARREHWHNRQDDPRHWDSFRSRGPSSNRHYQRSNSAGFNAGNQGNQRSQSYGRSHSEERSNRGGPGDHYSVLQISHTATAQDIKKAYRKLCLVYHPDKNKEEGTEEKFHAIKHAYDVLSNPTERASYDRTLPRRG